MPNVMTPDGKKKTFSYDAKGKEAASNFQKKNPGSKIKSALVNRQMNKGKSNGYS
tara:strand:- start:1458 stop:1622 length:165 start_codon:yes stop_codon:yes gene_type:complete